ncbi:hypothetical protein [Microbispora catharanthi]|uniref:hypothetical protein n=1 Tax=Microbispora catharanthi TaxID=1712871 RepID=UPI00197C8141|nr:hypothetical protein [Microbispora catharanthi]
MREWYRERDLLPDGYETVIGEDSPLEASVRQVLCQARRRHRSGRGWPVLLRTVIEIGVSKLPSRPLVADRDEFSPRPSPLRTA